MTEILDCGHPESPHSNSTRGYGRTKDGKTACYDCCTQADLEHMDKEGAIVAYLRGDGKTITNWPGMTLMTVQRATEGSAGGFCARERITRVWATDRHGAWWYGRGPGRNMYIRMRRSVDNRAGRR